MGWCRGSRPVRGRVPLCTFRILEDCGLYDLCDPFVHISQPPTLKLHTGESRPDTCDFPDPPGFRVLLLHARPSPRGPSGQQQVNAGGDNFAIQSGEAMDFT